MDGFAGGAAAGGGSVCKQVRVAGPSPVGLMAEDGWELWARVGWSGACLASTW